MQSVSDRIRELRLKANLTQEELGRKIGVTSVSVSKWELDTAKPKSNSILKLCKVFNVDVEWLVNGRKPTTSFGIQHAERDELINMPYFEGLIELKGEQFLPKNQNLELISPKSFFGPDVSNDLFCLKFLGDSMEPEFKSGSILCVDRDKKALVDGKTYAVNHEGMLRIKFIENTPKGVKLRSFNPAYKDVLVQSHEDFFVLGTVIAQLSFYH